MIGTIAKGKGYEAFTREIWAKLKPYYESDKIARSVPRAIIGALVALRGSSFDLFAHSL
jgi:hypothetical protein